MYLFYVTAYSQAKRCDVKEFSKKGKFISFIVKVDIGNASKDGVYMGGYIVHIPYFDLKRLDGKIIRVEGQYEILKGSKKQQKRNKIRVAGYNGKTKHIYSPLITEIELDPKNFVGENVLISGVAKNEDSIPIIEWNNWKVKLKGMKRWNQPEIGKIVEVYGIVQKTDSLNIYKIENCNPKLVKLDDMLGNEVSLRGTAWNTKFNYRGIDIYVEDLEKLPNWKVENHGQLIEISGRLEQEMLPDLDQKTIKTNPDLKLQYIVRDASWTLVEDCFFPEIPPRRW